MSKIKHVSLDAWNTILIPNTQYARRRSYILAEAFSCSPEFAAKAYTAVKRRLDKHAEETGEGYATEYVYNELLAAFPRHLNVEELRVLRIEDEFLNTPPSVLEETKKAIQSLKDRGITVSISSNTNFISGRILGRFLQEQVGNFDFMLFSDTMQMSHSVKSGWFIPAKPSPAFFSAVAKYCSVLHPEISAENILHIGDNEICDYNGAKSYGFQAKLLPSVNDLPEMLMGI
jgi:putative hydrolase of the HAD superfamily